jgi:hypothetical protein
MKWMSPQDGRQPNRHKLMTIDLFPLLDGYRLERDCQLLLQAALCQGDTALTAWERWQSAVDIEALDCHAYQLLSQLYQNLLAHGIADPQMARLKGIYRRNWSADRLQLQYLDRILTDLQQIGIEAIVLGDVARAQIGTYCQISSFELLVRAPDLVRAIDRLTALDWHSHAPGAPTSIHLQDDRHRSLYLQGRLFWAIPQAHTDDLVWHHATPRQNNLVGWQLSATDLFLHLSAQIFFNGATLQLGNIAATMKLMQPDGDLDWLRLVAQAQRYQLILPVRNTLLLLERVVQISPPEWVLPALWQMPISQVEWLKYRVLAGDRQGWRRSRLAHASASLQQLFTPIRQLRSRSFPGKQLLKPTTSALE